MALKQQLSKKGWYYGLASRFSDHYFIKIEKDDIRSRCGQINMSMLKGKSITELKLYDPKATTEKHLCGSCVHLLLQDAEQKRMLEPFRY